MSIPAVHRLRVYRIVKPRHERSAWTGEGASKVGGRWNSRGIPAVYCAGSLALAAMEMLVHLEGPDLLARYRWAWIELDSRRVIDLDAKRPPRRWYENPPPVELKQIGDAFLLESDAPALRVPSAVVPTESNYLLNPAHPEVRKLRTGRFLAFRFDPRLLK